MIYMKHWSSVAFRAFSVINTHFIRYELSPNVLASVFFPVNEAKFGCCFAEWLRKPTPHPRALSQTLTPLCEGHSVVLRWLVEGPEVGVSSVSRGLMGPVCVDSLAFSTRFEVLCRSTKAWPSALLVSPSSSLKNGAVFHQKEEGKPAGPGVLWGQTPTVAKPDGT